MNTATNLFDKIKQIVESRPLSVSTTEQLFGTALQLDETASTAFFEVSKSAPSLGQSGSIGVELRIPTENSDKSDGMLILAIAEEPCINTTDLPAWLGEGSTRPPDPNSPPSLPIYSEHRFDWGTLSIGVARSGNKCVRSIVLNAI